MLVVLLVLFIALMASPARVVSGDGWHMTTVPYDATVMPRDVLHRCDSGWRVIEAGKQPHWIPEFASYSVSRGSHATMTIVVPGRPTITLHGGEEIRLACFDPAPPDCDKFEDCT